MNSFLVASRAEDLVLENDNTSYEHNLLNSRVLEKD